MTGKTRIAARLVLVLSLVVPGLTSAQVGGGPGGSVRTRADLERLLAEYQQVVLSTAYSDELREQARDQIDRIEIRLRDGDFRLGDAVILDVRGEEDLPDTVAVESGIQGPILPLPVFGDVQLHGVLRSEITEHLTQYLTRYIRDPVVRAEGLMRVSIQGSVGRPGFYALPADMLLSEAIMAAGGPRADTDLDGLRIERGVEVLFEGEPLQEELRLGATLDQLNLQAGDQLFLPTDGGGGLGNIGLIVGLISSLTLVIVQLTGGG